MRRASREHILRDGSTGGTKDGDNIQLEVFYKAFMDGTGKSGKDLRLSLLEKQDKAKRGQISRARQRGEDLVREDLSDAHDLFAFQDQDKTGLGLN